MISEYGLESVPYNRTKKAVTWETCTLREWLNETFYNDAFTAEERNHIVATTVTPHENPNCTCDQGNETTDYIFLLSATEYEAYIKENGNIHTKYQYGRPTAFTRTQNVDATGQNDYCWYWLRTSATDNVYACSVNSYGTIDYSSREVYKTGGMVRPAMWITVE